MSEYDTEEPPLCVFLVSISLVDKWDTRRPLKSKLSYLKLVLARNSAQIHPHRTLKSGYDNFCPNPENRPLVY